MDVPQLNEEKALLLSNAETDDVEKPNLADLKYKNRLQKYRSQRIIALPVVIVASFLLFYIDNITRVIFIEDKFKNIHTINSKRGQSDEGFTIRTEGCSIPHMTPFSADVNEYFGKPDIEPCKNAGHPLLISNKTHIWIHKSDVEHYNITNLTDTTCCYKSFYRSDKVENVYATSIDNRATYRDCVNFSDIVKVSDEFVRVTCEFRGKKVYDQMYIFAPKKEIILYDGTKEVPKNKSAYNVIILGIDAVSRLNFHRTMSNTSAFLNEKGTIEMLGYNKVGDNSYMNIIPILMGYHIEEIKKICHPNNYANYDFCPLIWNFYKEVGYYTAYGEDSSYASTFNYLLDGFIRTPTDYYAHPFIHQAEHNVGSNGNVIKMCLGDTFAYQVLLDYAEDIFLTLQSHKGFGFFWETTISHEYLNGPLILDGSYEKFFKKLDKAKYLDESIIFLISDHGARVGSIRNTKQGGYEERLPLLSVLTPPSFRTNYSVAYKNLIENTKRLTTPFDLHATLVDLVDLVSCTDEQIKKREKGNYANDRGITLFLPIPTNRTCQMAAIPDHHCTCYKKEDVKNDTKEVLDAGANIIKHLNGLLKAHQDCAVLSLKQIKKAAVMMSGTTRQGEKMWKDYVVVVKATPGDGVFEGTLRYNSYNWTVSGSVSRLNLYGNQSRCVNVPLLKKYCFCN